MLSSASRLFTPSCFPRFPGAYQELPNNYTPKFFQHLELGIHPSDLNSLRTGEVLFYHRITEFQSSRGLQWPSSLIYIRKKSPRIPSLCLEACENHSRHPILLRNSFNCLNGFPDNKLKFISLQLLLLPLVQKRIKMSLTLVFHDCPSNTCP